MHGPQILKRPGLLGWDLVGPLFRNSIKRNLVAIRGIKELEGGLGARDYEPD